jgi:hypothetical protein
VQGQPSTHSKCLMLWLVVLVSAIHSVRKGVEVPQSDAPCVCVCARAWAVCVCVRVCLSHLLGWVTQQVE